MILFPSNKLQFPLIDATHKYQYDREGRKLECIKLYEEGIALLLQQCKLERDPDKKRHFHMKLNQYMTQAEKIKESIRQRGTQGVIKDKIHIIDGARNFSYATIFGKYLDDDVREVAIEEPYLSQHFQMCNLVMFCELLVSKCRNLHFIKVTTKKDDASNADQAKWFQSVTESLAKHNVCLQYELVDSIHDRQVKLLFF